MYEHSPPTYTPSDPEFPNLASAPAYFKYQTSLKNIVAEKSPSLHNVLKYVSYPLPCFIGHFVQSIWERHSSCKEKAQIHAFVRINKCTVLPIIEPFFFIELYPPFLKITMFDFFQFKNRVLHNFEQEHLTGFATQLLDLTKELWRLQKAKWTVHLYRAVTEFHVFRCWLYPLQVH